MLIGATSRSTTFEACQQTHKRRMSMNILITVASRHGSTREIAEMLTQELRMADH